MNHYVLAALARERRESVRATYAHGALCAPIFRPLLARVLRASGDRLFRLGVALDGVAANAAAETPTR